MTVIWCMVPEIWSAIDRIFCHFGPFFALLPPNNLKNQNSKKMEKISGDIIILHMCFRNDNYMMCGSWNMERKGQIFLSFWTIFCTFTHPWQPKKSKFWKNEKSTWRCYHFSYVYHKWQSYCANMVPEIWCMMERIFCHLDFKIKILKN